MLHLTNGDATASLIRRTGVSGAVVAWRDVLYEGPVPAGLSLEGMSDVRARFLASRKWGTFPEISAALGARDSALRGSRRIVLWFEHDLHDQLQLLQILSTLSFQSETTAEMICIGAHPAIHPFHGLAQLSTVQLAALWPSRRPVTLAQLTLGRRAWAAFTSPNPAALINLLGEDLSPLPFLAGALTRLREELPAPPTGLSRTDRQILAVIAAGHRKFADVFRASQAREQAPFMSDLVFRHRLATLATARSPLINRDPYTLTAAGRRLLAGEADARQLNGTNCWIGGVHVVD